MSRDCLKDIAEVASFEKEISGSSDFLMEEKPSFSGSSSLNEIRIENKEAEAVQNINVEKQPEDWMSISNLDDLRSCIASCKKCPLAATRKNFVFGEGNPNADILVIGEGPGAEEDNQGKPFVGRSGQLLTKILEAIQLSRDDVFIANIVKCRPPLNRRPETGEIDSCEPYLKKQIELIKPAFILALGLTAIDTLLKKSHRMADIRGHLLSYCGITTMATYHPAALLRNPNLKKDTWEDVKKLQSIYRDYLNNNK